MGKSIKITSVVVAVLISLVLVIPVFATEGTTANASIDTSMAHGSAAGSIKDREALRERIQNAKAKNLEIRETLKNRASDAAQRRKEKLTEVRLKLCEARSKGVAQRVKYMLQRGKVIHTGHEKIYARVDKFYNEKLVPNGFTLPNYADLKAEVEANKANVLTLLDAAKQSGANFNCSSDDPKGQIDAFHDDIKALIEANNAYKKSIHTFVKAVRDLAKTAKLDKLSPGPSSGPTPKAEVTQ